MKNKRTLIILISLFIILFFRFLPDPQIFSRSAMQVIGIFLGILLLWLFIAIDWPSLLLLLLLAFIPEIGVNELLAKSIGSSTFAFLLFTFICTYALSSTSIIRRIALVFLRLPFAKRGPKHFAFLFFSSALLIGLFMSPTVLFVLYLPILEQIRIELALEKKEPFSKLLMIGMCFSISISCAMTPIAHVFSVLAMGFYQSATGLSITFSQYMLFAIPTGLLIYGSLLIILLTSKKLSSKNLSFEDLCFEELSSLSKREKWIISIFFFVVFLWIAPSIFPSILPQLKALGSSIPPLLGTVIYLILEIDNKPLLHFKDAMQEGVQWSALIMSAATLALGFALTNESIGLIEVLKNQMYGLLSTQSLSIIVLLIVAWTGLQTNLSSNMVTITVVCAITIPLALTHMTDLKSASITAIIGFMGSLAFVFPPAHPNVALAGASDYATPKEVMVYGSLLLLVSIFIVSFIGYPLATIVL